MTAGAGRVRVAVGEGVEEGRVEEPGEGLGVVEARGGQG